VTLADHTWKIRMQRYSLSNPSLKELGNRYELNRNQLREVTRLCGTVALARTHTENGNGHEYYL
jgi:hypothetical protein